MALFLCVLLLLGACGGGEGADTGAVSDGTPGADAGENTGATASVKTENWDTLVYGMMNEPAKLDPQNDTIINAMFVNKQIYNTLVTRNDLTGEIEPSLATSWEWQDNTTLVMKLRDDVTWHNGEKFTAEDVLFTLQRFSEGTASATLFKAFDAENSRVLDEYTIEIKLFEPYGPAINMLASMKAAIVSKNYWESVDDVTFSREPIGTGPFKFVEWVTGDHITLVRNEEYWGQKPSFTNLEMRIIIDASARAIEIETGGVDIVDSLTSSDIERFGEGNTAGVKLYTVGGTKIHYLSFNEDDPIFSNEKVRLAFAHAIDMEAVTDAGFGLGSGATVAGSSMASSIFGYVEQGQYEFNPELSKQLLAEAGYPDGFTCQLIIPESGNNVRMGESIQSYLAEIGVTMEVCPYYTATWQSMARDGSAKLSIQNLTVDSFDADQNYSNLYADSTNLVVRTQDETVNRLLNEGRSELDTEKRKAIYKELQEYIFQHAIQLNIDEPITNYVARDYIEGLIPNPGVQLDLTGIIIRH